MTTDPAKLLHEALKLPQEVRAALAASLLGTLEEPLDEASEAEWSAGIALRIREIDSGAVQLIPWSKARQTIMGRN